MKCQITSDTIHKVMISRDVKVASYKEICYLLEESVSGLTRDKSCPETSWQSASGRRRRRRRERRTILTILR